jgi:hypothetical protein
VHEKLASIPVPPLLQVELVPRSCHFSNLRSNLPARDWNTLRQRCYHAAGYICEVCGGHGNRHPVECHEIWEYDDLQFIQTLRGVTALCPSCHRVKHMALAREMGWDGHAERHFCRVNRWTVKLMREYMDTVFEIYEERSKFSWALNINWLAEISIQIPPKLDRCRDL